MTVTFDPATRLDHLENYLKIFHLNLTFEEARVQLLRHRLTGYKLAAELDDGVHDRSYIDEMMMKAYQMVSLHWKTEVKNPYQDPCKGQYELLSGLRSYLYREMSDPFMIFIRSEFRKIFVPTLRLLTELCTSENKYSWEEVKAQLQRIMDELGVEADWEGCEVYLDRYVERVSGILDIGPEPLY